MCLALAVYTKVVESGKADKVVKRLFREILVKQSMEIVVIDYAIDLCLKKKPVIIIVNIFHKLECAMWIVRIK